MIIALVLLLCILWVISNEKKLYLLSAGIAGWSLYLYVVTELLSAGKNVTYMSLRVVWGAADLVLGIALIMLLIRAHMKDVKVAEKFRGSVRKVKRNEWVLFALFCLYSGIMLWLAYHIVPYNWDSMTYHLTRILAWSSNQSIGHFATTIKRTVGSPVFGEVINLHVYILSHGSDQWFNMLQCLSYLLNILFVYGIARKSGCNQRTAVFASFLFLTTPIAFAEALTTQVDEFSALWLLMFVYVILDLIYDRSRLYLDRQGIIRMLLLAAIAGFGYLTKPSVMIGMFGFTLWLLVVCIQRQESPSLLVKWMAGTGVAAILVIMPEIIRNLVTYGAISDPWQGKGQIVHSIDPRYIFVGFLKNLFFNLPSNYWPDLNHLLEKIVYWTAYIFHIDADNEAISESARAFALAQPGDYGCDSAVSPVPVAVMIVFAGIFIIRRLSNRKQKFTPGYTTVTFITFMVFCAIARWEPWVGRYMISYLGLLCPALAFQIWNSEYNRRNEAFRGFICGMIFLMCLTGLGGLIKSGDALAEQMEGENRAKAYYYYNSADYESVYLPLQSEITGLQPETVGIVTGEDTYAYPVMKMLTDDGIKVQFVNAVNSTAKYEDDSYHPDNIILIGTVPDSDSYDLHGNSYHVVKQISDQCYVMRK